MVYFILVQCILMYDILVWDSAYNNVLKLLNITHRTLIRVIMIYLYDLKTNTIPKTKYIQLKQQYNKTAIIKIHMSKTVYEFHNIYITQEG